MDIHNFSKRIELAEQRLKSSEIPEKNKKLILEFVEHITRLGLSKGRIAKYLETLPKIGKEIGKEFDMATKKDVEKYISKLYKDDYGEWTMHTFKIVIKRFYKWLRGLEGTKDYPEEVKWIPTAVSKNRLKLPNEGDLLNEEEIKRLIETSESPRDKAFVSTLWESGCRIGEILCMRIKDVVFDNYGTLITVSGKTGSRKLRLISSSPQIQNWIYNHPYKDQRNELLWINTGNRSKGEPYDYKTVCKSLQRLFKKANIQKRCNPHSFRHARATFLANHLTEFQMNQYFGWTQGSDMPSTYVHLSGKSTDSALLKLHGIVSEEEKSESKLKPVSCPRCAQLNEQKSNFCLRCGSLLDSSQAVQFQEQKENIENKKAAYCDILVELLNQPEFINVLTQKLKDREMQKTSMSSLEIFGTTS